MPIGSWISWPELRTLPLKEEPPVVSQLQRMRLRTALTSMIDPSGEAQKNLAGASIPRDTRMFETAEIGNAIDRETYKREAPKVREALLAAQRELPNSNFRVVILVGGV